MSKQLTSTSSNNDVQKNFSWRTLGPGILLASVTPAVKSVQLNLEDFNYAA